VSQLESESFYKSTGVKIIVTLPPKKISLSGRNDTKVYLFHREKISLAMAQNTLSNAVRHPKEPCDQESVYIVR
jgi:hypothetical protein